MTTGSYSEYFGGGSWSGFSEYIKDKNEKIKNQLIQQFQDTLESNLIFQNCVFLINGRTEIPDIQLKELLLKHGGIYEAYNLSKVTHIISETVAIGNQKWQAIRDRGHATRHHIVTTSWVLDSIKQSKRLRESDYKPAELQKRADGFNTIKQFLKPVQSAGSENSDTKTSTAEENVPSPRKNHSDANKPILCTDDNVKNFVKNFFSASRLHYIGTWKKNFLKNFKVSAFVPILDYTSIVEENQNLTSVKSDLGKTVKGDISRIIHVDFDAFFVSVALKFNPPYINEPVVISHGNTAKSYGAEIASCNYKAQEFGIKKGMWIHTARKLCPDLKVLPYYFDAIEEASASLFDILTNITTRVMPTSCDEAYVQLIGESEVLHILEIAQWIQNQVFKKTGCTVSIGIGYNRYLAKLASMKAKRLPPDEKKIVCVEQVSEFLQQVELQDLPGIGDRTIEKLHNLKLYTCRDVLRYSSLAEMKSVLGQKLGLTCWAFCLGYDLRTVPDKVQDWVNPQTITVSVNWGIRITQEKSFLDLLEQIAEECEYRLVDIDSAASDILLKILIRAPNAPVQTEKYGGCGICVDISKRSEFRGALQNSKAILCQLVRCWNIGLKK